MPGSRARRLGPAVGVLALAALVLLSTLGAYGVAWDEPYYMQASESYVAWLGLVVSDPGLALGEALDAHWRVNSEHPPLAKLWGGLWWRAARGMLPQLSDLVAHRIGPALLGALLAALVFGAVARVAGLAAGGMAAGALLLMPRFFYHAHVLALDVPGALASFAVLWLFFRCARRSGFATDLWLGVAFGLALATKINALFTLPTLALWLASAEPRLALLRRLGVMALVGVPLSGLVWPWLWSDPLPRIREYARFLSEHFPIAQYYLGELWMPPPWHFPFVMLLAVTPLATVVLAVLGASGARRSSEAGRFAWLMLWGTLVPLLALATGQSAVYDDERLFLPSFPALAALAGLGFRRIAESLGPALAGRRTIRGLALAGVAALVAVGPLRGMLALHPHLLSYYALSVGGLRGAQGLGLETTYWCETYLGALEWLNAKARPGARLWVQGMSHNVLLYYQIQGRLRADLVVLEPCPGCSIYAAPASAPVLGGLGEADYVVLQQRESGFHPEILALREALEPAFVLARERTALLEIYDLGNRAPLP